MREIATSDYWNKRVKESTDMKDMLFRDDRREEFWRRVREQLSLWKDKSVLDVCCGYGQFADIFDDYTGYDISTEMLALAKARHPNKNFGEVDVLNSVFDINYDVVFEVNSLHSLGMTPEQFKGKFNGAKIIACLEADVFTIFQNY